jgi:hypothetical protein
MQLNWSFACRIMAQMVAADQCREPEDQADSYDELAHEAVLAAVALQTACLRHEQARRIEQAQAQPEQPDGNFPPEVTP